MILLLPSMTASVRSPKCCPNQMRAICLGQCAKYWALQSCNSFISVLALSGADCCCSSFAHVLYPRPDNPLRHISNLRKEMGKIPRCPCHPELLLLDTLYAWVSERPYGLCITICHDFKCPIRLEVFRIKEKPKLVIELAR